MTLHLIAHVVRGQSAFDIAERLECHVCHDFINVLGDSVAARRETEDCGFCNREGFWWIIPTSGHRAYPYWDHDLNSLLEEACIWPKLIGSPPEGWPDHFSCKNPNNKHLDEYGDVIPIADQLKGKDLLAQLGLARQREPIRRRI